MVMILVALFRGLAIGGDQTYQNQIGINECRKKKKKTKLVVELDNSELSA